MKIASLIAALVATAALRDSRRKARREESWGND